MISCGVRDVRSLNLSNPAEMPYYITDRIIR